MKGGPSVAVARAEVETQGVTISDEDSSVGLTVAAGWDVQLGDGDLYLPPNAEVMVRALGAFPFLATVGVGFR